MDRVTKTILELYKEVETILEEGGIQYIAGGSVVDILRTQKSRKLCQGVIYIHHEDVQKMLSCISENLQEDREIETFSEEGRDDRLLYINKETTFVEFTKLAEIKHPGLHVQIVPLEKKNGKEFVINANGLIKEVPESIFTKTKQYRYKGYALKMPVDIELYHSILFIDETGEITVKILSSEKYLTSSSIAYRSFINSIGDLEKIENTINYLENDIRERTERIDDRNEKLNVILDQVKVLYNIK